MKQKELRLPEYDHCIANLANSIMKHWELPTSNASLEELDDHLKKDHKNVVVILLDGMGKCILDHNLEKEGFFNQNLAETYSSVFPPTTVAATTAILSGMAPKESGWLGWDCYYPQIDKNVTVFFNVESGTEIPAADFNVPWTYYGYQSIAARIREAGGKAYEVVPFFEPYPDSFSKECERIKELCQEPGEKYIYCYWNEPDLIMHEKGRYSNEAKQMVRQLEEQVEELAGELEDTLLIITADHGHMDSKGVAITDYPEIMDCLVRLPSIEPRALNLFIKEEKKEEFERLFLKTFGDKFILWDKQKVLDSQLFGTGKEHQYFKDMLGDYLAIAVDDLSIYNTRAEAEHFIGVHAGMTKEEMEIPLIIVEK